MCHDVKKQLRVEAHIQQQQQQQSYKHIYNTVHNKFTTILHNYSSNNNI